MVVSRLPIALVMAGVATFAEVLEQELAAFQSRGPASAPAPPPPPAYRPPHPFLFATPQFQFRATAYGSAARTAAGSRLAHRVRPLPPPTAPRPLTAIQQRAFDQLIALGADLGSDCTARELRSAYRTLARRFHPDRHPASSETEKARLARMFADLSQNHRCFLTALREPAVTVQSCPSATT